MHEPLLYEELDEGAQWVSAARTVTEADVVQFATSTGDLNPLHVDHEFARATPFRRPIAHGLLGLSWVAGLGSNHPNVATDAFVSIECWEFHLPLLIGDTVHVRTELLEKEATGRRRGRVRWKRELVNQEGRIVQSGVFTTLVATAAARRTRVDKAHRISGPKADQHVRSAARHGGAEAS